MQMKESKRGDVHRVLNRPALVNDKGRGGQGFVFRRSWTVIVIVDRKKMKDGIPMERSVLCSVIYRDVPSRSKIFNKFEQVK